MWPNTDIVAVHCSQAPTKIFSVGIYPSEQSNSTKIF